MDHLVLVYHELLVRLAVDLLNICCDLLGFVLFLQTSISHESHNLSSLSEGHVVPTRQAEASKALVGGNTIAENYAFVGVHHIFDQVSWKVLIW